MKPCTEQSFVCPFQALKISSIIMASQDDQDLQFWDNPNSPNYNLVNQSQPRTLLERAMPILVVILSIMVAILLPLAISNHVKVSNNEGKRQPFTFVSCPSDPTTNSKNKLLCSKIR